MSLFLVPVVFGGCKKNLDKVPVFSPSNVTFYSTEAEIVMAVNACYQYVGARIAPFPTVPLQMLTDFVTDIGATRLTTNPYAVFKTGQLNSGQGLSSFWWNLCYQGINRTNALLDNMHRAEASANPVIFKRVKSEARAIRALMYIYLVQNYGDVPLVTKVLTVEEGLQQTRTAKATVAEFIYTELEEAAADLPNKYTATNEKGRITKGAAYALKARMALYNGDWQVAKTAAKACMDLNVYKLFPSYREQFLMRNQNNEETILDDQYMQVSKQSANQQYLGTRMGGGQVQAFPTEDFIAGVECTDGMLITESPTYDKTDPFANRDPRLYGAVILPRVWDGVTIKSPGTRFNGCEYMSSKETLKAPDGSILPTSLTKLEERVLDQKTGNMVSNGDILNAFPSFTGYALYKYADSVWSTSSNSCYNNFTLCRFAEVLLTYVEASVELGQVDQSVLDALNMTRARAYGNTNASGVTNIDATNYPRITTTDVAELRKIVRRERKVELCFEGFRLQDLRRWGLLEKALNGRNNYGRPENYTILQADDMPIVDGDELFTFPYATEKYGATNEQQKMRYWETFGTIPAAYNLLPIPIGELQLNPQLTQNPGYN